MDPAIDRGASAADLHTVADRDSDRDIGFDADLDDGVRGAGERTRHGAVCDVGGSRLALCTRASGERVSLARRAGRYDTLGVDLVHRCVDDLLAARALPRAFTWCVSGTALDGAVVADLRLGVARGCRANGIAVAGGEIAEGAHAPGAFDVCGTALGAVVAAPAPSPAAGDVLIGLAAVGPHGGHGAIVELAARLHVGLDDDLPGAGTTLARALLAWHKSYLGVLRDPLLHGWLTALAPVADGGLGGALRRALPADFDAVVDGSAWQVPAWYAPLLARGGFDARAAFERFDLGLGMLLCVRPERAAELCAWLRMWNEPHVPIGQLAGGVGDVRITGALRFAEAP